MRKELESLQAAGTPIRIGISGAGWMGSGFVAAVSHVPGMEVTVIETDHFVAADGIAEIEVV